MSSIPGSEEIRATVVADAIGPYRSRLLEDAADFSAALLVLAEANAKGSAGFNEPSPQDAVALHVLVHWRRDAKQALSRVKAASSGAPGKGLATNWLKTLISAIDLQRQSLSLSDPGLAADAARRGRARIAEAHRLEEQLDRVLT
jgi:hypothetical protein